ncbi:MAG: D-alanyl-D-alanine carboxypeptidase [Frankiaceae bacterium]|nr:D-alanyl-D-alanine carboxypeptidase [Frankiaceae bacterium]
MYFPRRTIAIATLSTAAAAGLAQPAAARSMTTHASLASKLTRIFHDHNGAKHLTFSIHDSTYGNFTRNSTYLSQPASNQKVFTAITLMDAVGPSFRYATTVSATKRVVNHIIDGDLVVRGSGDPTLTRSGLLDMAKRLHRKGIHRVTGHLIVDDTRYSHKTSVSGWKPKFVPEESGPVDAFTVDHNAWKHNATFLADPSHANGKLFRHYLRQRHIKIHKRIEVGHAPRHRRLLMTHRSASLAAITDSTLTDSINFDAEMMLREAGAQRSGHGSPKTGAAAVNAVADKYGLPSGVVHDGSGLSYSERSSPDITTRWLLKLRTLPYFTSIYYALPLSCRTGTLEHRLCGRYTAGQVRAKTGTLDHASTLSGYVTSIAGHYVTFSFYASKVKNFGRVYKKVDKAIGLLRRKG